MARGIWGTPNPPVSPEFGAKKAFSLGTLQSPQSGCLSAKWFLTGSDALESLYNANGAKNVNLRLGWHVCVKSLCLCGLRLQLMVFYA
jgi:hypothetical protein